MRSTNELVKQLRSTRSGGPKELLLEAAETIERLEADIQALKEMGFGKCGFQDGIMFKPDGVHILDPCRYEVIEKYANVTVEISRCMKCGSVDITWYRQEDTVELEV